jgi:hypothetical protein
VLARLEAGPAVDLWTVEGESRRRWAGWAGAAVEWPLGRHLRGALRASGALSPSVFDRVDLPDDVERLTSRRWGVAVALRYAKYVGPGAPLHVLEQGDQASCRLGPLGQRRGIELAGPWLLPLGKHVASSQQQRGCDDRDDSDGQAVHGRHLGTCFHYSTRSR